MGRSRFSSRISAPGRQSNVRAHDLGQAVLGDLAGAERVHQQRHRLGNADRVRDLHLAATGQTRSDDVLGDVARVVAGRAIDLRRVLAREGAAAVPAHAAVRIDDDLAPGQAGVAHRAADDEASGRVDEELGLRRHERGRQNRPNDLLHDRFLQGLVLDVFAVLGRDDDRVDGQRPVIGAVADRDLALAVGAQEVDDVLLADVGQLLRQLVRRHDRQRHQLRRFVAGVAEHHSLVAGALLVAGVDALAVHALRDVRGLLLERDENAAGLPVEAHLGAAVADVLHDTADDLRDVDARRRGHLAGDHHESGLRQRLAGDARALVVLDQRVQDRVRDLVAQLVGVAFGDAFGGEEILGHSETPYCERDSEGPGVSQRRHPESMPARRDCRRARRHSPIRYRRLGR